MFPVDSIALLISVAYGLPAVKMGTPRDVEAAAPYGAAAFCPPAGRGRQILEKACRTAKTPHSRPFKVQRIFATSERLMLRVPLKLWSSSPEMMPARYQQ